MNKLCLEEGEGTAADSLDMAVQLLNRRQIDMPLPSPAATSAVAAEAETAACREEEPLNTKKPARSKIPSPTISAVSSAPSSDASPAEKVAHDDARSPSFSSSSSLSTSSSLSPPGVTDALDRDRRLARTAAFNNGAVLLVAAGRGGEALRLLRACISLLPGESRPVFNLALVLWRLNRPRAACAHWLEARGWLDGGRRKGEGESEAFTRLLELARRRKVSVFLGHGEAAGDIFILRET